MCCCHTSSLFICTKEYTIALQCITVNPVSVCPLFQFCSNLLFRRFSSQLQNNRGLPGVCCKAIINSANGGLIQVKGEGGESMPYSLQQEHGQQDYSQDPFGTRLVHSTSAGFGPLFRRVCMIHLCLLAADLLVAVGGGPWSGAAL